MRNNMKRRWLLIGALVVVAVLAGGGILAACGGTETTTTAAQASSTTAPAKKLRVGVAYHSSASSFNVVDRDAKAAEAAKLGIEIVQADASEDANKQAQQIADLVASGIDGLIIQTVDAKAGAAAIKELGDIGIPIITGDRFADMTYGGPDGANPKVHVGWSDFDRGKSIGDLIVSAAGGQAANVVLEEGVAGSAPQIEMDRGIKEVLSAYPAIKIIDTQYNDFDPSKAITVTENLLAAHPDIDILATQDDNTAAAAANAVKDAGRLDKIKVIGSFGSKAGTAAVESGLMYGTSMLSPSKYGTLAIDTIYALMTGGPLPEQIVTMDGRPTVPMSMIAVTKDNVAQYPGEW